MYNRLLNYIDKNKIICDSQYGFRKKHSTSLALIDIYDKISSAIDHLRNRLNFDLNKSRQKFHHSLKEHHKISNIPKFRCEML